MKQSAPAHKRLPLLDFIIGACPGILPLIVLFLSTRMAPHSSGFYHLFATATGIYALESFITLLLAKKATNPSLLGALFMFVFIFLVECFVFFLWGIFRFEPHFAF